VWVVHALARRMGVAAKAWKLAAQQDRVGAAVGDVEAWALRGDEGVWRRGHCVGMKGSGGVGLPAWGCWAY
jgi:hypothetical protein